MAIDPSELKTHILATPALTALWSAGDNSGVVDWYARPSGSTAAKPLPASELIERLRGTDATLKLYQARRDAADPDKAGAADLFLEFARGGGTIERDDAAFVAAVQALVAKSVLTAQERNAISALFEKSINRGEAEFGETVTLRDVRAARKV